ncbi:L-type lectin-domain containing receptor kinase IX.2 [Acorus calamus]|uniref:L-type lectin-domain containing receptor kinase IX.2 n=1 Tax=Acorus calamus TaxID=4465 RepID=A0AAV9CSP8_ACOCL|nr:L-type lectin-domain containing receptor kinase IX.2 [Acorus calamus]
MWKMWARGGAATTTTTTTTDDDLNLELERWPQKFPYSKLVIATKNFKEDRWLGEGGFGVVYRGFLDDVGRDVAIKRLSDYGFQGLNEYLSEVRVMSRLRHRNVIQLFGYCHETDRPLLVYELAPNGSLDSQLFKSKGPTTLSWARRRKIVRGLAYALRYLQEECTQSIVHRDIKPSNVYLDKNFEVKLGDFGLSMLVDDRNELDVDVNNLGYSVSDGISTRVMGTHGYADPEYVCTGRISKESDLYGFGIVALQIACGKTAIIKDTRQLFLTDWIWEFYKNGKLMEAVDQRLGMNFDHEEMERLMMLGLWCTNPSRKKRPSIRQIIGVLDFEAPLPELEMPPDRRLSPETTVNSPQTLPPVIAPASSSTSPPICNNTNSQPSCAVANSKKIFIGLQGRCTDKIFASGIIKDMTGEMGWSKTYTYSREIKTNTKTISGKMYRSPHRDSSSSSSIHVYRTNKIQF